MVLLIKSDLIYPICKNTLKRNYYKEADACTALEYMLVY